MERVWESQTSLVFWGMSNAIIPKKGRIFLGNVMIQGDYNGRAGLYITAELHKYSNIADRGYFFASETSRKSMRLNIIKTYQMKELMNPKRLPPYDLLDDWDYRRWEYERKHGQSGEGSSSFTSMSDSLDHVNVHQYLFPKGAAIRYEYFLRSGLKLNCHSVVSSTITQEEQSALNQSGDKEWLFCTSEIIGADGGNILVAVYDDNFSLDFLDKTIQIYQSGYSLHLGISIILVVFIGIISLPFFLFFMKKRGREHQKEKSGRTQHSQDFNKNDREAVLRNYCDK